MPAATFMVIDSRHDHSFRVPRPEQTVRFGVPNTCNQCHREQSAQWAADQVAKWYGHAPEGYQRYAQALYDSERTCRARWRGSRDLPATRCNRRSRGPRR